jgi:hypothetical protein
MEKKKNDIPSIFVVMSKKEKVFFLDMQKISKGDYNVLAKFLGILALTIIHYGGTVLNILFNLYLKRFNKIQFKNNMIVMNNKADEDLRLLSMDLSVK